MNPMAELVEGRLTLETAPGYPFTLDALKDLHSRAMMLGIPTNATVTNVAWHIRHEPNTPQQMTVYWRIERPHAQSQPHPERSPFQPPAQAPAQAPAANPYPNPMTRQES